MEKIDELVKLLFEYETRIKNREEIKKKVNEISREIDNNSIPSYPIALEVIKRYIGKEVHDIKPSVYTATNSIMFLLDLGLSRNDISEVVEKFSQVLEYSIDYIHQRVKYLLSLGLTKDVIPGIIRKHPQMLEYSIEDNMKPKYQFLIDNAPYNIDDIKNFPIYFSYSFEYRIVPRWYAIVKNLGKEYFKKVSLKYWLYPNDEIFARKILGMTLEEYNSFIKRNKDEIIEIIKKYKPKVKVSF